MSENEIDLSEEGFEGSLLLNFMRDVLAQEPKLRADSVKQVGSTILLTLKNKQNQTKAWFFEFRDKGTVAKAAPTDRADIQLFMKDTDFVKLVDNKVSSQKLFLSGRLKVKGNLMKAVNIEKVLRAADPRPKL